jgi:glycosyltransferase involved in cell wall biosynthesis
MKLLTVAIPTFERVEYLKELLPEMIKQCKPFPDVEILINDNDSQDGTWSYIRDLERANENVRAEMNLKNVGGDENFVRCVEYSSGNYVWLFGDDELLCENAIKTIVDILKLHPYTSLLMVCGDKNIEYTLKMTNYNEFIKNGDPQDIINQTLITGNIFKRSIFNTTVARKRSPNLNGSYAHIYAIADSLKKAGIVIRTRDPMFAQRPTRAPFKQHLRFIRLKWLNLLLYLGVPLHKIIRFALINVLWGTALRQVKKLGVAA